MRDSRRSLLGLLVAAAIIPAGCGDAGMAPSAEKPGAPELPSAQRPVIEESDIYRRVGSTLYVQNAQTGLNLVDVSNPAKPQMLGRAFATSGAAGELYVREGRAIVLLKQNNGDCLNPDQRSSGYWKSEGEIVIVDTTIKSSPKVSARWCLPGQMVASRTVNDILYVVTFFEGQGSRIYSLDLSDPGNAAIVAKLEFPDASKEIFVTESAIFVAGLAKTTTSYTGDNTHVQMVSIADDGQMQKRGSLVIPGAPQGRFHMDLFGTQFRIVTFQSWPTSGSRLTVIDVSNPDILQVKGFLANIGSGEKLYATRFDGDKAYVVTFRQTDPLWIISLANPAAPKIVGELHIPGWSDFLFPRGNRLIAVGRGDRGNYVGISLFDVSDPTRPQAIQQISLGDASSTSEATVDHRAAAIIETPGAPLLLAIPHTRVSYSTSCSMFEELDLVEVQTWGLQRRGSVKQQGTIRRAFLVASALYSISDYELVATDITNRDQPVLLASLALGDRLEMDPTYASYCQSWEQNRQYYDRGNWEGHDVDDGWHFCAVGRGPAGAPPLSLVLLGLAYLALRLRRR